MSELPIPTADSAESPSAKKFHATVVTVSNWLNAHARLIPDAAEMHASIVERLLVIGLPIARYHCGMPSLHPQVDGVSTRWEKGKGFQFLEHRVTEEDMDMLRGSPIFWAFEHGQSSRHRLLDAPTASEPSIFADLRAAGLSDYLVVALPFSDGSHKAMTFATDAPDGFGAEHVEILCGLVPALAATVETRYLSHLSGMLMETYVGPVAGRKVLAGDIKRGAGETIHAVIWFCDLKEFTTLSQRLSDQALLETLNQYFEVMTTAIESRQGEVLKFIGDAILAIFQPTQGSESGRRTSGGGAWVKRGARGEATTYRAQSAAA